MQLLQALILGLIQGITEFLPISSSGHLIIFGRYLGFANSSLAFDVALHVGTLLAVVIYFRRDLVELIRGFLVGGRSGRLARLIILGTIPAVVFGYFLESSIEANFRSPVLVAVMLAVVALIMWLADRSASLNKNLESITPRSSLLIGLSQSLALIPGVSRSGITISAGLASGLDRVSAMRFSFLLSVPITLGATLKVLLAQDSLGQVGDTPAVFLVGSIAAFASGYAAIRWLLRYLSRHSLDLFIGYRLALAVVVLLIEAFK